MSKRSKQTGNFYQKRNRLLEEAGRSVDELNITLETVSTSVWPDLGVEVSQQDLESLFTRYSSVHQSPATPSDTTDQNNEGIEEMDDPAEEIVDAKDPYSFMQNLSLKDALVHLVIQGRASRFLIEGFLAILRKYFKAKVPKTKRTLLKTPTQIGSAIKPIQGGQLWYHGIENVLEKYFEKDNFQHGSELENWLQTTAAVPQYRSELPAIPSTCQRYS
ncbi:uncharacterized protein LOC118514939 [Anopheles stephensi]|uniref:uncharacterized protein LOC118514000 n=1 Tax=Anopheles stephensi TaxID=30069 RepID=UPI001658B12B|nr:uncharacterized protein LOC118514000 [Anopheles stephensi]XP_035917696.1 uncharacterized protein LOC118514939 [Anopheles stephensi]